MKKIFLFAIAIMASLQSFAGTVDTDFEMTSFSSLAWKAEVVNVSFDGGEAVLTNAAATTNYWDYQYWLFDGATLDTSKDYTVTLTGKAEGTGTATVRYKVGNWDGGATGEFTMTAGEDYKDYSFKVTPIIASNGILLQHGDFVGTIKWKKVTITHEDVTGLQKVLVITSTADKANPWDSQVFINMPSMTAGKQYFVKFLAKSTADFNFGSESIDDKQTEHHDQWKNSAVFNYTADGDVTSEFKEFQIALPGKTDVECNDHGVKHEGFEYAATALLLNIGKLPKDAVLTIAKIVLYDENMVKVADVNITGTGADNKSMSVYYPNWQNSRTVTTDYIELPTSAAAVKGAATDNGAWYTIGGVKVAAPTQGLYIHNGKVVRINK